MKYLLDSNTYIQSKNFAYQMSFCPAYWDWLDEQANQNTVGSINFVRDELIDGHDELGNWAKKRNHHFLDCSDTTTQNNLRLIANFVMQNSIYSVDEKAFFMSKADPWLIAKAITIGATITTLETMVGENSKKIKIPNICDHFNINCITNYELLATIKPSFVLSA